MATFVVSDLHGYKNLYDQICEFLYPEDIVICLGDCGDRGPQSWELIKAVYENPQWEYLMGNHEHMLISAMEEKIYGRSKSKLYDSSRDILFYNGGKETFEDWLKEEDREKWYKNLCHLPLSYCYLNNRNNLIILTHAGFTPTTYEDFTFQLEDEESLLWDRLHYLDDFVFYQENDENIISIHGHTPNQSMMKDINTANKYAGQPLTFSDEELSKEGAVWYYSNHKVNIDMGTYNTKKVVLLDLDTFHEYVFEVNNE